MISGSRQTIVEARRDRARVPLSKPDLGVAGLIPRPVLDSPLMKMGGYQIFEGIPVKGQFERLQSEVLRLIVKARQSDLAVSESGGIPARRQLRAAGGKFQRAFYHGRRTLRFLREVSGLPVEPTGAFGAYLYYTRPGDYVAPHRDGEGCDLVVITSLYDAASPSRDGGMLCLYPDRLFERIDGIRATPAKRAVKVRIAPGQTMVLFGGYVAHSVLPVCEGQRRIVSSLCYRLVNSRHNSTKQSAGAEVRRHSCAS